MSELDAKCWCGFVGIFDRCPVCDAPRERAFRPDGKRGAGPLLYQAQGEGVRANSRELFHSDPELYLELIAEIYKMPNVVTEVLSGSLWTRVSPFALEPAS